MKVGIITVHRIANYGSALQSYALQKTIENWGYDCEIIDYIYPNSYHRLTRTPKPDSSSLLRKIKIRAADFLTESEKREIAFSDFRSKYLKLSKRQYQTMEALHESPPQYDIYISGSDQVWNTTYLEDDATFLLDFAPKDAKRISYASSFGQSSFDQRYAELYRKHLRAYSKLSVRERTGIRIIADLTGQSSQEVLDPTLLMSAEEWLRLAIEPKLKRKYILCYFLGYSFNPHPYAEILAKHLKKIMGYELVLIFPSALKIFDPSVHAVFDAGPREFLGWFANAEMVLTTSLHGSAFSINFNKPFLSLVSDKATLDCRQQNLLEGLNLHNRILPINSPLPDVSLLKQDYEELNKRRDNLRQNSLHYLKNALSS